MKARGRDDDNTGPREARSGNDSRRGEPAGPSSAGGMESGETGRSWSGQKDGTVITPGENGEPVPGAGQWAFSGR